MPYYFYGTKDVKYKGKWKNKSSPVYTSKTVKGALAGAYRLMKKQPGWEIINVCVARPYMGGFYGGQVVEYFVYKAELPEVAPEDNGKIIFYKNKEGKYYEWFKKYELKSDGSKGKRVYCMGDEF